MPQFPELANLSFLVLQGIVSTENMQYAHVVFPSTTFVEMDGTLTNLEGRVQRLHQAIPPVGQSRPGWKIINDLAERIAHVPWNYHSAAEVMMEIASIVPAYAKVNYETLSIEGLLRRFQPTAKMQFIQFNLNKISQLSSEEFPLTLITERNLFHYHAADLTKHVTGMNLIKESGILQLNPSDAARLGIVDGDSVKVESTLRKHGIQCSDQRLARRNRFHKHQPHGRLTAIPNWDTRHQGMRNTHLVKACNPQGLEVADENGKFHESDILTIPLNRVQCRLSSASRWRQISQLLTVRAPIIASKIQPGQFVIVRATSTANASP